MAWNEAQHQRAAKGSSTGGQFISYDAKSNRGTGYGHKGGDARVKRLQKALNALGHTDGKGRKLAVDGQLGPLTTQSVKAAQVKLGIKPADGRVTPELLNKLEDLAAVKHKASKAMDAWMRRRGRKPAAKKPTKRPEPPKWEPPVAHPVR